MNGLRETAFEFPYETRLARGKVRDVYVVAESVVVMVASDRVSAFDVVLPDLIPHKGQALTQTAAFALRMAEPACPTHFISSPDPNVIIGLKTEPYPIEVVVRAHLCGHAWRQYKAGRRELCGVRLPDGLRENDPLPEPILTPTTKSRIGHDIDITETEIIRSGLVPSDEYAQIRYFALAVFQQMAQHARSKGLILADTKYEFGERDMRVFLIDEAHTPDSSRYFIADGFEDRQDRGERQPQYSKEFLREWLMTQGFQGEEGQEPPRLTADVQAELRDRYARVYETLSGDTFTPRPLEQLHETIYANTLTALAKLKL